MTLGLVFCSRTHDREVWKDTSMLVLSDDEKEEDAKKYANNISKLNQYLTNEEKKKVDMNVKSLYECMKNRHSIK